MYNYDTRYTYTNSPFVDYYTNSADNGYLSKSASRTYSYNTQQLLNYNKQINQHNISALLGHEYYNYKFENLSVSGRNFGIDNTTELATILNPNIDPNSYSNSYNNEGYFFRGMYNYASKYFGSVSYRRDASSRFSTDYRWGNFWSIGGATDYPAMRVEEMHFLKAEALLHTKGLAAAKSALEDIVKTRNSTYVCSATNNTEFIDEYVFQKGVEFWGEGVNYFDAKRLEVGIHRAYLGNNNERYQHLIDMDGVFVGWTPGWNQAELNANRALLHYNNPFTNPTTFYFYQSNDALRPSYGIPLN